MTKRMAAALLLTAATAHGASVQETVHPLSIGRSPETHANRTWVSTVLDETSSVLAVDDDGNGNGDITCRVRYEVHGDVAELAGVPGVLLTPAEVRAALSAGPDLVLVNGIRWCNGRAGTVLGCARRNGGAVVRKDYGGSPEVRATTWAHEIGHISGLDHRNEPNALMHEAAGRTDMFVNAAECRAFKKGPTRSRGTEVAMANRTAGGAALASVITAAVLAAPADAGAGQGGTRVGAFLARAHHHGVPIEEARKYSAPEDIRELERIVLGAEPPELRSKAAEVLGMVGSERSFEVLRLAAAGDIDADPPTVRLSALTAIGTLTARRRTVPGFEFLETAATSCVLDRGDRCASLATAAVVGLALTEDPDAPEALCRISAAKWTHDRVRAAATSMLDELHPDVACKPSPAADGPANR